MMGVTFAHMGEFALAMEHSEKSLSLYDPEQHRDDAFYYSQNPGVAILCHSAWVLWFLGQPAQSLKRMNEGLSLARELSEPHGLAHAFFFAAILSQLRGEARLVQERAEAAFAFATEHGLLLYQAHATFARGWALVEQGMEEEGIEQMRQGIAAHEATGTEVMRAHFLALLAEALGKTGQLEEGLRLLDDALSFIDRNGERYYHAELYRLKGELLLRQSTCRKNGGPHPSVFAQVEECFNESIRIAMQQKAKSWELRAVMSMARLYQDHDKHTDARRRLSEVYDSFTEGFDTVDLREAKALLDELS